MGTLLYESNICRLCAVDNTSNANVYLYDSNSNEKSLSSLINQYLPVQVNNDGKFPCIICNGCQIRVHATVQFFDALVEGQKKLRELWKNQVHQLKKNDPDKKQFEKPVISFPPQMEGQLSDGITFTISVQQPIEDDAIGDINLERFYSQDNAIALQMVGLQQPKRKRGRPRKVPKQMQEVHETPAETEPEPEEEPDEDGSRSRRKRKAPQRYLEAVRGKELERIFKEEGVIDEDEASSEAESDERNGSSVIRNGQNEIIGHLESADGQDMGHLVVNSRLPKSNTRKRQNVEFVCEVCGRSFYNKTRYLNHRKLHQDTQIRCAVCSESFTSQSLFDDHRKLSGHTGMQHSAAMDKVDSSAIHHTDFAGITSTLCEQCDKQFSSKESLATHIENEHSYVESYRCNICDKTFPSDTLLKYHHQTHNAKDTGKKSEYPCDICGKILNHPSSVIYHKEAEHNDGRQFVCSKCGRGFKHKQLLHRHQLVHSNDRPYECKTCKMSFKTKANLLNHESTHSGIKKYFCNVCGNQFAHKTSLTLHYRWHTGEKPFQCKVCGKWFSQNGNLQEHMRIHTGEKPFSCEFCLRKFTTSSQYKLHVKRHTGEKPWRCEFCNRTFLHKDSWKCHVRRHRGEKPFSCSYCSRGFTEQWALKKHVRLHTGERPYTCTICGKAFSDCSNLTKHKRVHRTAAVDRVEKTITKEPNVSQTAQKDTSSSVQHIVYLTYQDGCELSEQVKKSPVTDRTVNLSVEDVTSQFITSLTSAMNQQGNSQGFQITDEDGNPLQIVQEGRQVQITTVDGQCLQVVTGQDTPGIPIAISDGSSGTLQIPQVLNDTTQQETTNPDTLQNETDLDAQTIEFTTREGQQVRLVGTLKFDALQFATEYLANI